MASSIFRNAIIGESFGSSASDTLVRSMYEIVYMISATGMMRSQRCSFISGESVAPVLPERAGLSILFARGQCPKLTGRWSVHVSRLVRASPHPVWTRLD